MKKYLAIVILILFALNTNGNSQSSNENVENDDALKIGVLVPLTGEYKSIGKSVLRAVQLAVTELKKNN